jgi:hypothetical protein
MELIERERAVLDFEDSWWLLGDDKLALVRERLEMSPLAYFLLLHRLLDRQEALDYAPLLVRRLRKTRDGRRRQPASMKASLR